MALFSRRRDSDETDEVDAPEAPARVASGQTGPVSRPVAAVAGPPTTGPTPIVELHDTLLHTATPRYIAAIGLAATMVTGILATISSFKEVGLLEMRPQIDEAFLISIAVLAFGGLWWSTFATANGRRVTRGRTVGPILPMFVYVGIAVSYLAVNANVHGEARLWAWVVWLLVAFAAHSFVMVAFRSSAETIGNPTTHFTQVAMIPVMIVGVVAIGIFVGPLRGIPFLAVPVLMAWMVPELFRAMHGWDRACTQRMRVMLRDFSYDTPSGQVAAVETSTPAAQPQPTPVPLQAAAVTNPEQPGRVAGTHHPQRPVWNPVEEARKKAELQAAAAMNGGMPQQSALDAYVGEATPRRVQKPRRRHHTQIPKLLVTFWVVSPLLSIPMLLLMEQQGHIDGLYSADRRFDDLGRIMLLLFGAGPTACYFIGWMWWATASLANARLRSLNAPWPGIVPASHWTVIGGLALIGVGTSVEAVPFQVFGYAATLIAYLYCYFGVLSSLRKAAGIFGAPREPWTLLMRLPFYVVGAFFATLLLWVLTRQPLLALVGGLVIAGLVVWGWVSLLRGVWSFDRLSRAPVVPRNEEAHVPLFMRQAMGAR